MHKTLAIISMFLGVYGCNNDAKQHLSEARDKSEEALSEVGAAADSEADAYRQQLELRMQAQNGKIDALRQRADRVQGKAKQQTDTKLLALEKQRESLQKEMDALKGKSKDAWHSAKSGFDKALDDLESAYEDVKEALE